jgi:pimeloyl-ACP methyl ester carboxylesterase
MKFFEHDGLRLAYAVVGEGFPVVLHTGAAGDSRMWLDAGYVDGLAGFQVILFDHRGHGASAAPDDPRGYAVEQHVADVVALSKHLGLSRFAFWGYSAGARIGYQLAVSEPRLVAALIAQGTVDGDGVDPDEWLEDARLVRAQGLEPMLDAEEVPPAMRDNLLTTDRDVLARGFECFAGWTPWPLFPKIEAPTLIIVGELEDEGCVEAASRIPSGRAVILPGLGHLGALAQSGAVLPHALAFLHGAIEQ